MNMNNGRSNSCGALGAIIASPTSPVVPVGVTIARRVSNSKDSMNTTKSSASTPKSPITTTDSSASNNNQSASDTNTKKSLKQKDRSKSRKTSKKIKNNNKTNASWQAFIEGAALYAICLLLPSLMSIFYNNDLDVIYQNVNEFLPPWVKEGIDAIATFFVTHFGTTTNNNSDTWMSWLSLLVPSFLLQQKEEEQHQILGGHNDSMIGGEDQDGIISSSSSSSTFASDTDISDAGIVFILTLSLAVSRLVIVHLLVPRYTAPKRMEALVRCKSQHLLSAGYNQNTLTPNSTVSSKRIFVFDDSDSKNFPVVPSLCDDDDDDDDDNDLNPAPRNMFPSSSLLVAKKESSSSKNNTESNSDNGSKNNTDDEDNVSLGLSLTSDPVDKIPPAQQSLLAQQELANPEQTMDSNESDDSDEDLLPDDELLDVCTAASFDKKYQDHTTSLDNVGGKTMRQPPRRIDSSSSSTSHHSSRVYAAPRYATAVFRLLYCTCSCIMALVVFRDADFWPWYVFGHGTTKNCWDLSGGVGLFKAGLDSDFDHHNTVLRRYFLLQVSYHLHSWTFHVLSVILMLLFSINNNNNTDDKDNNIKRRGSLSDILNLQQGGGNDNNNEKKRFFFLKWSLGLLITVYIRTFFQHSFSLVWISGAYLFSSLRRLGAIGIFALDMSSWSLHLLQVCINAPLANDPKETTTETNNNLFFLFHRPSPKVIQWMHRLLVVPSFIYFRFIVWPFVGLSAVQESKYWLEQLEHMLVPGSAKYIRMIFQLWMILWMGFHMIHFKRLLNHPHISRIVRNK